jgi:hypothetical protein
MKNIFRLNLVFILLPVILCTIGLLCEKILFIGMLTTLLTGVFQVVIGLKMIADDPSNKKLQLYFLGVIIYFILFFFSDFMNNWRFFYPQPFFTFYFTYIMYQKI